MHGAVYLKGRVVLALTAAKGRWYVGSPLKK
jgi:hypothetical protein